MFSCDSNEVTHFWLEYEKNHSTSFTMRGTECFVMSCIFLLVMLPTFNMMSTRFLHCKVAVLNFVVRSTLEEILWDYANILFLLTFCPLILVFMNESRLQQLLLFLLSDGDFSVSFPSTWKLHILNDLFLTMKYFKKWKNSENGKANRYLSTSQPELKN